MNDDNVSQNQEAFYSGEDITQQSSPGVVVLQWLTYGFWGWAILALGVLVSAIITNLIAREDTSQTTIYALAAILVLLPIAFICDYFYTKNEPSKKTGVAMFVMVVHAVLFAFIGIATLIAAVFSTVQIITSSGEPTVYKVVLYSSSIMTFIYIAIFMRTVNPAQLSFVPKIFKLVMVVFSVAVIIAAIAGPISYAQQTKNDRLIENNLYKVNEAILTYTRNKKKLPDNLSQLNLGGDAKILVDKNLVEYKPNTITAVTSIIMLKPNTNIQDSRNSRYKNNNTKAFYQLCVNFAKSSPKTSNSDYDYDDGRTIGAEENENLTPNLPTESSNNTSAQELKEYKASITGLYNHPAGEKCFKLYTYNY